MAASTHVTPDIDCWDEAYQLVQQRNPRLVDAYLILLTNDRDATNQEVGLRNIAGHDREARIRSYLNDHLDAAKHSRTVLKVGDKDIRLGDIVDGVLKATMFAQSFITQAVSGEPHAALAWAGVSLLWTPLMNSLHERRNAIEGLETVANIMLPYRVVEARVLRKTAIVTEVDRNNENLRLACQNRMIEMFSMILEYQIRLSQQCARSRASRLLRNMVSAGSWKAKHTEIIAIEAQCAQYLTTIASEDFRLGLLEQQSQFEGLLAALAHTDNAVQKVLLGVDDVKRHLSSIDNFDGRRDKVDPLRLLSSTLDYRLGKDRNPPKAEGTCVWCLDNERYKSWLHDAKSAMLFVTGEPGCGKSVLSRYLVDHELPSSGDYLVCYFFFKDESLPQRSITEALCAVLHQLLNTQQHLSSIVAKAFASYDNTFRHRLTTLWELLLQCSDESHREVFCVFDALDEADDKNRAFFVQMLNHFYRDPGHRKMPQKIFITGRPYFNTHFRFAELIMLLPAGAHIAGEDQAIGAETSHYIKSEIETLDIQEDAKHYLWQKMVHTGSHSKTYLWAKLVFDVLRLDANLSGTDSKLLAKTLDELPPSIFGIYETILNKSTDRSRATTLLHIILASTQPLTVQELQISLRLAEDQAYTIRKESDIHLQRHDLFKRTIRAMCGSFVTFTVLADIGKGGESEERAVLLHATAQQFLMEHMSHSKQETSSVPTGWQHSFQLRHSHYTMAKVCVRYLLFEGFGWLRAQMDKLHSTVPMVRQATLFQEELQAKVNDLAAGRPFLAYASIYWIEHLRSCRPEDLSGNFPLGLPSLLEIGSPLFFNWLLTRLSTEQLGNHRPWRFICDYILSSSFLMEDLIPVSISNDFRSKTIQSWSAEFPMCRWKYSNYGTEFRFFLRIFWDDRQRVSHGYDPLDNNLFLAFELLKSKRLIDGGSELGELCQKMSTIDLQYHLLQAVRNQNLSLVEEIITQSGSGPAAPSRAFPQVYRLWLGRGRSKPRLTYRNALDCYVSSRGLFPDTLEFLVNRAKEEDPGNWIGPEYIIIAIRSVFAVQNCRTLLRAGAKVNYAGGPLVKTESPLMMSIMYTMKVDDLTIPRMLLDAGADPACGIIDQYTNRRVTALSLALEIKTSSRKYTELIIALVDHLRRRGHLEQQRSLLFVIAIYGCTRYVPHSMETSNITSVSVLSDHDVYLLRDTRPYRWLWLKYDCLRDDPYRCARQLCEKYLLSCPDLAAKIAYHEGFCIHQGVKSCMFSVTNENKSLGPIGYTVYTPPVEKKQQIPTNDELETRLRALGA